MKNTLKQILICIAFASISFAQTTLTLSGPTSVRPGQSVEVTTTLSTTSLPAGLQWVMSVPAPLSVTSAVAGTTSTSADKTLYRSDNGLIHLVVGLNVNTISSGPVAKHTISIPGSTPKGSYTLLLSDLVAGDVNGDEVVLTSGTNYSILVLAKTDLNGDGSTNISDFTIMWSQVFGKNACVDDQNGDGKCNVLDLLIIIRGM